MITLNFEIRTLFKQVALQDIASIRIPAEMIIGKLGGHSASWRTLDEAFHDEEWLVNLLYGAAIFADSRGDEQAEAC